MAVKFYKCMHCGNEVDMIYDSGVNPVCCGTPMTELKANTKEGVATEKHIPVVKVDASQVTVAVGEVPHPMVAEHWIEWIYLITDKGAYRRVLKPGDKPEAYFGLAKDEKILEAYAFCNIHGLWKVTL
ncbi:MAG: desulfoferrodoxin [Bacilli bacterium]|nr:desulfoferrodoxin [Bacilli bacterium]MCH4235722.1 desulfoferrodoxin [Bacilli bacterium]